MARVFVLGFFAWIASPHVSAATWTVAPSGGDFTTIQAAIDAAATGDVVRVMSGTYGSFSLTKDLALLGVPSATSARPTVTFTSTMANTSGRIAGLKLNRLELTQCSGIVLLDDLEITSNTFGSVGCDAALLIRDCSAVHLARSVVHGKDGDFYCEGAGLVAENSNVTATACSIDGGTGWGDDFYGYPGRPAVLAIGATRLLLSDTDCYGGDGGTPAILFGGQGGIGAPAIELAMNALPVEPRVVVRGDSQTLIFGGQAGQGIGGSDAYVAVGGSEGVLTFSGATHSPATLSSVLLEVVTPNPPDPFTALVGGDLPNDLKHLRIHGPFGAPSLLLVSTNATQLAVPGVLGSFFVDPSAIVATLPFVLTGQDSPIQLTFTLPPVLLGLENQLLTIQSFTLGISASGAYFAGNPTFLLLRG